MSELHNTAASLRIFGDLLDPDESTQLIGKAPTRAFKKGDVDIKKSGRQYTQKTGSWILKAPEQTPGNLDLQIEYLLSGLTNDLAIWRDLKTRFRVDLFCGLFMRSGNDGLAISAKSLLLLGERGIEIDLDIYGPGDDCDQPSET